MNRDEASRLTLLYLTEKDDCSSPALDYPRMLTSLTEYASCWYVDFHYRRATRPLAHEASEAPGFTIDKNTKQTRIISWEELFELNCERHPF